MTTCLYAPEPLNNTFFIPGSNTPGNGVKVFFYQAGTSTKQTAFKDNAGAASHTNPMVLDSGGNPPSGSSVWFAQGETYKVVYAPANDTDPPVSPYVTYNNLSGINDPTNINARTYQFVTSYTISSPTSQINFNTGITWSAWDQIDIYIDNLIPSNHTTNPLVMYVSGNSGGTYSTTNTFMLNGNKSLTVSTATSVNLFYGGPTSSAWQLTDDSGLGTTVPFTGVIRIPKPSLSQSNKPAYLEHCQYRDGTGSGGSNCSLQGAFFTGDTNTITNGINGIAFGMKSIASISTGTFRIYGIPSS